MPLTSSRAMRLRRRNLRLGIAAAVVLIAVAFAVVIAMRSRDTAVPLNPDLVAVAMLANETGDATLEPVGRMAAERVAQGIQQRGVADVVPPSVALAAAEQAQDARDRVRAFAEATGAGVLLHGAYYLLGDSLQFQIQITDVVDGELMAALRPVTAPSEPATEALDLVSERVLGTLAAALDFRSGALWLPMQPRSLEAYRLYREEPDDFREHARNLRAAWAMDSTFFPALVWLAATLHWMACRGGGDTLLAEADSLFQVAEGLSDRMSEAERLALQGFHERRRGADPETQLRRLRRMAELAPNFRQTAAGAAASAYRPREALEHLARVDTTNPYVFSVGLRGYRLIAMGSLHMLENHEEALQVGHAAHREFPEDVEVSGYLLWSLAALGRIDDLNALLDSVFAFPHWRRQSGAFTTPAGVANVTAVELRAHGHRDAAPAVLERALDWLEARPAEEIREMGVFHLYWRASTLYKLERWEEARAAYEELAAASPDDARVNEFPVDPLSTVALAGLGAVAARMGDGERARAISGQLAETPKEQLLGRARIAALLGEREEAVGLLREALVQVGVTGMNKNKGWYMLQRHHDMDLEPLRGYPPFEQFMRPRG